MCQLRWNQWMHEHCRQVHSQPQSIGGLELSQDCQWLSYLLQQYTRVNRDHRVLPGLSEINNPLLF